MGGKTAMAAPAAPATPSKAATRTPRVIVSIPYGGPLPRASARGATVRSLGVQVGKERALRGGRRRALATSPLVALGSLGLRLGRPRPLGARPALLMGDLVSLLDHHEIDEAGEGIAQELEVFVPVARRIGESFHLVGGEHQGTPVPLPRGQPQLLEDARATYARGACHVTPSSRRMRRAASTMERSLATPTQRGVSQSPQSGTSHRRGAGMCRRARRTRAAISSGVSTWKAFTPTTPPATSLSVGNSLHSPISLISRFAYSKTNWLTRASRRRG